MLRSPSGKLVQIEHALTAVGSGQTSLGIKGNVAAPGFYLKLVRARVYRLCDLMGELVFLVFSVKYWFRFRYHDWSIDRFLVLCIIEFKFGLILGGFGLWAVFIAGVVAVYGGADNDWF